MARYALTYDQGGDCGIHVERQIVIQETGDEHRFPHATTGGSVVITSRRIYAACFVACVGLMGFALYLQHVQKLDPCPLCIFQRIVIIVLGVVSLAAFAHNPAGWGRRVYAGMALALSAAGAGLAARHVWIQSFPDAVECGPGLGYMLEQFPLTEVFSKVLKGSGDCADVLWTFLGLSIPGWTLVVFAVFVILSLAFMIRPPVYR